MAAWAPDPPHPHAPTPPAPHPHIRKFFLREQNEIYQRGPELEVDCRYTNFFGGAVTPPPPWGRGRGRH